MTLALINIYMNYEHVLLDNIFNLLSVYKTMLGVATCWVLREKAHITHGAPCEMIA